jgi:ubiquitin-conjugating enzyme E2 O
MYSLEEHCEIRVGDIVAKNELYSAKSSSTWIGFVISSCDGYLKVIWADDLITTVRWDQVYKLDLDALEDEEEDEEEEEDSEDEDEEEETDGDKEVAEQSAKIGEEKAENALAPLEAKKDGALHALIVGGHLKEFPFFDSVEMIVDHQISSPEDTVFPKNFSSIVLKEYEILQKVQPDGIFVRVSEDRLELMRVLIIGPEATPFAHGIFCFDIRLPEDYPARPPILHYWNPHGSRWNPNLYETGRVCLSLLGTWSGRGTEVWDPSTSNILQVILSVQGLILGTPEPYFLEAGYDKFKGTALGKKSSHLYNERSLLMSFQAMSLCIKKPLTPFQPIIFKHFECKGEEILEIASLFLKEKDGKKLGPKNKGATVFSVSVDDISGGFVQMLKSQIKSLEKCIKDLKEKRNEVFSCCSSSSSSSSSSGLN